MKRFLAQCAPGLQPAAGNEKVTDGFRTGIDRTAMRVVRPGFKYEPSKEVLTADSKNPLPMRPNSEIPFDQRDLVGVKYGRMTVLGLSTKPKRWVVRCSCGIYTHRKAASIRNERNDLDRCESCRHLLYLQRNSVWSRTGRDIDVHEVHGA